jgi:MFS family permease
MASPKIPFNYQQARLLAVLALINFVNFADRQVLNPLLPLLRQHFGVSDAQLGSLQMVLLVILALASIPSGYLADRFDEPKIISAGVLFWSVAAICSGLAPTFAFLFVVRGLVGIGEAAYAPAAQSLISDSFSRQHRALAQSIFASGMILGGVSGLALGGLMDGSTLSSLSAYSVFFPAFPLSSSNNPRAAPAPNSFRGRNFSASRRSWP